MDPIDWWAVHPRLVAGNRFHMMYRHFPDYPQPWAKNWLGEVIGRYRLITLLREPVSRLVSAFNQVNQYSKPTTFSEYIDRYHEQNHQSRWLGFDGRDPEFLQRNFSAVGITERFDESMLLFRYCLGLGLEDVLYVRQRSDGEKRLKTADLSQEAIDEIRALDWLDVILYEQAQAVVAAHIDNISGIDEELRLYQVALKDYRHPLWSKRGSFPIGYSTKYVWAEFDSEHAQARDLRDLPS